MLANDLIVKGFLMLNNQQYIIVANPVVNENNELIGSTNDQLVKLSAYLDDKKSECNQSTKNRVLVPHKHDLEYLGFDRY